MDGVTRSSMLTRGLWLEGTFCGLSSGSKQYGTGSEFCANVFMGVRFVVSSMRVRKITRCQFNHHRGEQEFIVVA